MGRGCALWAGLHNPLHEQRLPQSREEEGSQSQMLSAPPHTPSKEHVSLVLYLGLGMQTSARSWGDGRGGSRRGRRQPWGAVLSPSPFLWGDLGSLAAALGFLSSAGGRGSNNSPPWVVLRIV